MNVFNDLAPVDQRDGIIPKINKAKKRSSRWQRVFFNRAFPFWCLEMSELRRS